MAPVLKHALDIHQADFTLETLTPRGRTKFVFSDSLSCDGFLTEEQWKKIVANYSLEVVPAPLPGFKWTASCFNITSHPSRPVPVYVNTTEDGQMWVDSIQYECPGEGKQPDASPTLTTGGFVTELTRRKNAALDVHWQALRKTLLAEADKGVAHYDHSKGLTSDTVWNFILERLAEEGFKCGPVPGKTSNLTFGSPQPSIAIRITGW